jgi:DNA-binding transcriptional MerR regulator
MQSKTYTITELESLTKLNRRTIHYYTQNNVIPPPMGAGGAARYNEQHSLRLTILKDMRKSSIGLATIKTKLNELSLEEMRDIAGKIKKRQPIEWDREAMKEWFSEDIRTTNELLLVREPDTPYSEDKKEGSKIRYSLKPNRGGSDVRYALREPSPADKQKTWERIEISEGVEMNVRSDIAHKNEENIKLIVEKLRQIMKAS